VTVAVKNEAATNIAFKTAAASASGVKVAVGTTAADTLTSTDGTDYVFPGAGNDILKITAASQSTMSSPDTILGIALGDVLDVSGLLTGYTSFKTADAADTGAGFIEIKNQAMTQSNGKSYVTFDVTFDTATYNSQKITGAVLDLKYAYSSVSAAQTTQVQFPDPVFVGNLNVWDDPVVNLTSNGNGKIALIAKGAQDDTVAAANPIINSNGKTLGVTLVINQLIDSFKIGFDGPTDNPAGLNSLSLADKSTVTPTVGITKTAYKTGVTATSVEANALILVQDTTNLGTVTDNQFRFVETVDANNNKTGTIKFQYDTNSAVGTTTLSEVVLVNLTSAAELSTFFAADHYKVI
jgi:hypothetical protein